MNSDWIRFYQFSVIPTHPASNDLNISYDHFKLFKQIAALIDLPDDGRLFAQTEVVVQCLIRAWEKESGCAFDQWAELEGLYETVADFSNHESTWGVRETNPVFALLLHPISPIGEIELSPQYRALIPFFIKRIYQCYNQVENPSDLYLYHLSLTARKLIVSAPGLPAVSRFDWNYETKLSIAIGALQKKLDDSIDLTTSADWPYISDLLFRDRKKLGKGTGGHGGDRQQRWLLYDRNRGTVLQQEFDDYDDFQDVESDQGCFSLDGKGEVKRVTFIHPDVEQKALAAVGEYEVDYIHDRELALPASWFTDPWRAKRKMRGKQESMVASERIAPWDIRCLSIRTVQSIFKQMKVQRAQTGLGIIAMGLLLGNGEQGMKKMKIGRIIAGEEPSQEVTEKLMRGDRYYDPKSRRVWWLNLRGNEDSENYLNVPLIVHLRLPRVITRHLPTDGKQGALVFSREDFRIAKKWLKRLGVDGISVPTIKRLQMTFEAFFIHGAGTPDILADHLQGRRRNHLVSQHYYISIPWAAAMWEWRRMVGVFLTGTEAGVSDLIKRMAFRFRPGSSENENCVGAVKTPTEQALINHADLLRSIIPDSQEGLMAASVIQWNAYASYLYLLLSICTGRRPQRDPFPLFSDFDLENGYLFVDDKWNRKFKESRIVPLCRTLHQAMINHLQIHNSQFMSWKMC